MLWGKGTALLPGGDEQGSFLGINGRKTGGFEHLGEIVDSASGKRLYRVHDLCLSGDRITAYIAETDVPSRSGYLWACQL